MGVQDAAVTTHVSADPSSPTNSANTDHASNKPMILVALSATEAVGWDELEAKVKCLLNLARATFQTLTFVSFAGKRIDSTLVPACQQAS
jgi:hypothetical protein